MSRACPSNETLAAFALGDLSADAVERVAVHVLDCDACERRLAESDGSDDPLVRDLAALSGGSSSFTDDFPEDLAASTRARAATPPWDGRERIGKFELISVLGTGSYGRVFEARDTELDRRVAIKIRRGLPGGDDADRFRREARSAAQLDHPGVASIYEVGEEPDGTCYIVEELVSGKTLEAWADGRATPPRRAAEIVAEAADALGYAHGRGVVHRDVKPSNLLLDEDGRVRIVDFGLAKRDRGETVMTPVGEVMGTPAYMSPEQARGDSRVADARTDVYSLGVILYELLTGERPFQGNRRMLILQVLEDDPRPPRRLNDSIPRDLETICLKALEKTPGRRYATAAALAGDLRRFLEHEPIQARPVGRVERALRWSRRNPLAASVIVAVLLGSSSGLVYLSWLSESFVRDSARHDAEVKLAILETFNDSYSEIVDGLAPEQVASGADYHDVAGKVPLPARLTIELCDRISGADEEGSEFRLYSEHPFPWRRDGGPRDSFESEALRRLRDDPDRPVWEFTTHRDKPVLRYVTARVMKPSCIGCHNHHPQSPKTDWRAGDVRGALEIISPLERDIRNVRGNLRGAFILFAASSVLVLGLVVAGLLLGRRRYVGRP